jgi:ribosomal protein S18 acetylase RimI-like enzyme
MNIKVVKADYFSEQHKTEIPMLLGEYACDPMGGGTALSVDVKANIVEELSNIPHAFSIIAYVDNQPAGLVNCFDAFSTFECQPIVNIHDLVVLSEYRGRGVSTKMLEKVEEIARSKNCCKITLEVLSNNQVAKSAYRKFGFSDYELDPEAGTAMFWQKRINIT